MAARAYMDARDPIQAEAALRRGLVLQPDSPLPYRQIAEHYLDLDRASDALGILQQGLERFPQALDLQMTLAGVSADLGKASEAIRTYQDVLSRRPDLDQVEYKLATLLAIQGGAASTQSFVQIARDLQSDHPSDPLLLDDLGWVRYRAGDMRGARALLQAAVDGAPEEPRAHFHLAAIHAREKRADLARSELEAALETKRPFPERLEAMRLLRESASPPGPDGAASATSRGH
jgi:Flp pilus assembly protein TadD